MPDLFVLISPINKTRTVYDAEPSGLPRSFSYDRANPRVHSTSPTCVPSRSMILAEPRPSEMVYGHYESEFTGTYYVSLVHYFEDCGYLRGGEVKRVTQEILALFPGLKTCGKCMRRFTRTVLLPEAVTDVQDRSFAFRGEP